ncbi:hypothetical protein BOX15_Mlig018153g1 [Macrostomum lignano]|uniref:Uncharacterized protein n=1 Tax=Macrostomum lignano TaxID=282301 RepID=A0A267F103_9PLAT|nr:hypothetical protein BOX15_Mlig018153g1 [Macrostomum lignano]
MIFHERPLWLRLAFILSSIGFIVWLSANDVFLLDAQQNDAKTAFLIIGLLTYFIGLAFTFACTFLDIFEGNNIVLLVDAGCMILAGISGLIAASIARTVTHSDKLGWSLLCALISGAFLILTVFTGGRGSGGTSNNQPQQQQSHHQNSTVGTSGTGAPDWRTEGGYYGPQQ